MFASSHLKQTVAKYFLIVFLMMDEVSMTRWKSFAVRVRELVGLIYCSSFEKMCSLPVHDVREAV